MRKTLLNVDILQGFPCVKILVKQVSTKGTFTRNWMLPRLAIYPQLWILHIRSHGSFFEHLEWTFVSGYVTQDWSKNNKHVRLKRSKFLFGLAANSAALKISQFYVLKIAQLIMPSWKITRFGYRKDFTATIYRKMLMDAQKHTQKI